MTAYNATKATRHTIALLIGDDTIVPASRFDSIKNKTAVREILADFGYILDHTKQRTKPHYKKMGGK